MDIDLRGLRYFVVHDQPFFGFPTVYQADETAMTYVIFVPAVGIGPAKVAIAWRRDRLTPRA